MTMTNIIIFFLWEYYEFIHVEKQKLHHCEEFLQ